MGKAILTPDALLRNGFEDVTLKCWKDRRFLKKNIVLPIKHHKLKTATRTIKVEFWTYQYGSHIRVSVTSLDAKYELTTHEEYYVSQFLQVLRIMGYNNIADNFKI